MIVGIQDEILKLHSIGLLNRLLADKTTGANILWATDAYREQGAEYQRDKEITAQLITGSHSNIIKNRARKALEQQSERTRQRGEVFTPLWVCRKMNDFADETWFGRPDVFAKGGRPTQQVSFSKHRSWQRYVDDRQLEITCGEAPYLVSRYDVATGEIISIANRIGILDRKLRVVNENTADEVEWLTWATRAFQAVYGYEFQGDSLLIARVNLLITFEEYLWNRWKRKPTAKEYQTIANIIAWNIWQMDGLTGAIPYCKAQEEYRQMSLFDWFESEDYQEAAAQQAPCRIFDWRGKRSLAYRDVNTGGRNMKFDFVIGNPPYQDESNGEMRNYAPPIYDKFMEACYKISDVVELIHPARFLFNAGSTPKSWNEKMLNDTHFKVLFYEENGNKVFPSLSTPLRGGVAITYRDSSKSYGAIKAFTKFPEVNSILHKVINDAKFCSLMDIVYSRTAYRLTDIMHAEHPNATEKLSNGHAYDMSSNIFQRLPEIFYDEMPVDGKDYIQILGRDNNKRVYKYIRRDYVKKVDNLDYFKLYVAQANGSGEFGETMSEPVVERPGVGATETFISIGKFDTEAEAKAVGRYIITKFSRTLLSVLKVTQNGNKPVWAMVPLQDFTSASDINWSKSVAEIDQQLYAKYGLDEKEIEFIETHVKEMV